MIKKSNLKGKNIIMDNESNFERKTNSKANSSNRGRGRGKNEWWESEDWVQEVIN